ncbi:MAG: Na+:solute symporter [Thermodesulfovibrionales bacterium]|nr:Na+:solute symporter [Thermodesulfovibrionales bacterium]
MTSIDWFIIALYFFLSLLIGLYFTKKASRNLGEFFLSGKRVPWWLAGISMVATTFSSDTPLYVTGLVRAQGIYENWQWWCFIFSGMMAVFVFAPYWKRLGVFTDVELISLRYSGKPARILRGFKALYFSVIIHTIIKAQVILAMAKILDVLLGWDKWVAVVISSFITLIYCMASGYWGVLATDFFQFFIAMVSALILCMLSLKAAGGIEGIRSGVDPELLRFFPPVSSPSGELLGTAFLAFLGYTGIAWWSRYSSDGGGVIVQRIISCKNEKEGIKATLFFNLLHYGLRTWPWILTALASLILYPVLTDHESAYPRLVVDLMPEGLRGLMVAGFFAAFMSTLSTYLNLSSAYFVNDFYKPFIKPYARDSHYLIIARSSMILLSIITAIITYKLESIVEVFKFLIAFGSGTGLVYILRWFWWRINAWSEISAMIASTVSTVIIYLLPELNGINYFFKLLFIVTFSTFVWTIVTFFTEPVSEEVLRRFYELVRPPGKGWSRFQSEKPAPFYSDVIKWLAGSFFIIGLTLGPGKIILGDYISGFLYLLLSLISGVFLYSLIKGSID